MLLALRSSHIVVLSVFAAVAVGAWLYQESTHHVRLKDARDAWLTLPKGTMDARQLPVRRLLLAAMEAQEGVTPPRNPSESLAMTCGSGTSNEPAERYVAFLGDWVLAPSPRIWRVEMVPQGQTLMQVSVEDRTMPHPPLPEDTGMRSFDSPTPTTTSIPIADLDEIRDAWSEPEIWDERLEWVGCLDGRPGFFEACVRGEYIASRRGCGHGSASVDDLWKLFQAHLPAPGA